MIHDRFVLDIGHGGSVYTGDEPKDIVAMLTTADRTTVFHRALDRSLIFDGLYDTVESIIHGASGFRCEDGARIDPRAMENHVMETLVTGFICDMFLSADMEKDRRLPLEDQSMEFRIESSRLADVTATLTIRMEIGDEGFLDLDRDGREAAVREAIGRMDIGDIADAPMTWEVE